MEDSVHYPGEMAEKGIAREFIIWDRCSFSLFIMWFKRRPGCVRLQNTRVSRVRVRGMSETATSLQDLRLCRDSSEPASPLGWISALTRGGKKGRIFQCRDLCTTPTSHLTGLFSQFSLFQLVIINRSLQLGSRRSQTAGAKPPASSSPLGQCSSSSLCL